VLELAVLHFTFYIGKIAFKMRKIQQSSKKEHWGIQLNYSKHKQAMMYGTRHETKGEIAAGMGGV